MVFVEFGGTLVWTEVLVGYCTPEQFWGLCRVFARSSLTPRNHGSTHVPVGRRCAKQAQVFALSNPMRTLVTWVTPVRFRQHSSFV